MRLLSPRHPREGGDPASFRGPTKKRDPRLRGDDGECFTPVRRSAERGFTPVRRSAEHGFTLVELMVVIVILGLLATIVAINVLPSGDRARVEKAKSDIATIESGLEMYKLQNFNYPSTADGLDALITPPSGLSDPSRYQKGGYLKKLPNDPWDRPYRYASPGTHGPVDIWTFGADGKEGGEGTDADITSWE